MALEEVLGTVRIGQLTGSIDDATWPRLVDPVGSPLLTDTGRWGVLGVDLGANTEHSDGRLYIFFGDVATRQGKDDPPLNSDLVAWTEEKTVVRHGGHLPIGWSFVLPFEPTGIQGQPDWQFCLKCSALFWNGDPNFKGVCSKGGGHDTFGVGLRFVLPFEPSAVQGQGDWRFCGKCAGIFWDGDVKFKGTCPGGGAHEPIGLKFLVPFEPTDLQGQHGWRFCSNCGGLFWDGEAAKGVCAGASGGGVHLRAVLDPQGRFDIFRAAEPIGFTGSLETPNGAFSFDGRVYVFAGIAAEQWSEIRRPGDPALGQYLFSKSDPTVPGCYDTEFLFSPKLGWCATDHFRSSFVSHNIRGYRFVLSHDLAASPGRQHGWRSCRKCDAIFFDGDQSFKGFCQRSGAHEADPDHPEDYSLAHSLPEDPQNQANWRRCGKCLALFWNGASDKGLCPGGGGHDAVNVDLTVPHGSIEEDHKNQASWRFCGKCFGLFFSAAAGVCPKDHSPHLAQGYDFVLAHDVGEDAGSQTHWRFCVKCGSLFYDGYLDKGRCPEDGRGHEAAGYAFSLAHGVSETFDRQGYWRFCGKCSGLFFNGFADKGVCSKDSLGHAAIGLEFALRHNPGRDANAKGDWRFCMRCFGMVRADQRTWFPWIAPCVVENARHRVLPQEVGQGLVMFGFDWREFRLAWMPLTPGARPRFDSVQYYHAGTGRWSHAVDESAGYGLFAHPFPDQYTHVSAAWLEGPECWIVLYATAWDERKNFASPAVARMSRDLLEWSEEIKLFDPVRERAYGVYMHMPGQDNIHPNLPPKQRPGKNDPGWAYGIFLLNRYTTWSSKDRILGIYYLLSLGSPYQVQLMHSTLRLP